MGYKLIRLHFETPVHMGTSRAEYDRVADLMHSDTLYSAIIQAWADMGIAHPIFEVDAKETSTEVLDKLNLGFTLSSLFPFSMNTGSLQYFFPAPLGLISEGGEEADLAYEELKKLKKVRFLETEQFVRLLQDGPSKAFIKDVPGHARESFMMTNPDSYSPFYKKNMVPHSYVPREGEYELDQKGQAILVSDTSIFYMQHLSFSAGSGLFGLVHLENKEAESRFAAALNYLQDEGLGSDRHTGQGHFRLAIEGVPASIEKLLTEDSQSRHRLSLSLLCPTQEELGLMIEGQEVRYQVKKRGGWIGHEPYLSLRKNAVYMFEEGSILCSDQSMAGKTVNLHPDLGDLHHVAHPIFRVGRGILLPINLKTHES